jgi:hypothetical protein
MSKKKPKKMKVPKKKTQDKAKDALQDEDLEEMSGGAFAAATKQASGQLAAPDVSGLKTSVPYPSIDEFPDDSDSSSDSSDESSSSGSSSSSKKKST